MNALASQPFTWLDVKPELRSWLQDVTHQIQGRVHAIGSEIVRVGVLLRQVRDKLPRGQFVAWVEEHFAFSVSHAYRLLHVGEAFLSHVSQIEKFEPSALYVLADPRVPRSAREFAVEQASDGRRVTRRDAIEIIDAYKPVGVTTAEQRIIESARKCLVNESPAPADSTASDAELGRLLREAVERFGMVHLSRAEEDDADDPAFSVTAMGGGQPVKTAVGSLVQIMQDVLGCGPKKRCKRKKCPGGEQSLTCFAKDKSNPDGLSRYCRTCEKKRMKVIVNKRRERKAQIAAGRTAQA
jgi:hypothetical protein